MLIGISSNERADTSLSIEVDPVSFLSTEGLSFSSILNSNVSILIP
jgi:hypothetical protein